MKEGRLTSEHRLAIIVTVLNMIILVGGGVVSTMNPDAWYVALLAGLVAMAKAVLASSYIKGRSVIKAEAEAAAITVNPPRD